MQFKQWLQNEYAPGSWGDTRNTPSTVAYDWLYKTGATPGQVAGTVAGGVGNVLAKRLQDVGLDSGDFGRVGNIPSYRDYIENDRETQILLAIPRPNPGQPLIRNPQNMEHVKTHLLQWLQDHKQINRQTAEQKWYLNTQSASGFSGGRSTISYIEVASPDDEKYRDTALIQITLTKKRRDYEKEMEDMVNRRQSLQQPQQQQPQLVGNGPAQGWDNLNDPISLN